MLPPDRVKLSNPEDVLDVNIPTVPPTVPPAPPAVPIFVVAFDIMRGERILQCGGTALEGLEREKHGIFNNEYPFGEHEPPFMSTALGAILDRKGVLGDAAYHLLPNGIVVDEFDQTLGLRLPTGCGSTQDIALSPVFHFRMVKVDDDHWKLVLVP